LLLEFNNILAELHAEAAKTTTFPLILYSVLSSLFINETPVAFPSSSASSFGWH